MAATTKAVAKGPSANAEPAIEDNFDWSKWLPKEIKLENLRETGGLTPIYNPEQAIAEGWPPVIGQLDRIELLPIQEVGTQREYTPVMIRVVAMTATKALGGSKDAKTIVDIKIGDDVLIPVTGGLKVKRDVLIAADDEHQVHTACFRVKGARKVNNLTPMWDWDVRLVDNMVKPRTGRFALSRATTRQLGAGNTEVLDRNGAPVANVVSS